MEPKPPLRDSESAVRDPRPQVPAARAEIRNPQSAIRNRASPPGGAGRGEETEGEMPCRSARRPAWKYVALAAVFAAWLAFLIYCAVAGN